MSAVRAGKTACCFGRFGPILLGESRPANAAAVETRSLSPGPDRDGSTVSKPSSCIMIRSRHWHAGPAPEAREWAVTVESRRGPVDRRRAVTRARMSESESLAVTASLRGRTHCQSHWHWQLAP